MPVLLPATFRASPAGRRAAWVLERMAVVASGGPLPGRGELVDQYTEAWLSEVPLTATLSEAAPWLARTTHVRVEPGPPHEARFLLDLDDGRQVRFRCVVDKAAPYRIVFQLLSPAMDRSAYIDRVIDHGGRSVHTRDFGGNGPLLLLWHGAGCDASVWEAMVPLPAISRTPRSRSAKVPT